MQAYPLTIGYVRAHGATKRVMGEGIVATFGIVILNLVRTARLFFFSLDGAESLRIQHCGSPRDLQEERQYIHVRTQ